VTPDPEAGRVPATILYLAETEIRGDLSVAIQSLLCASFPGYPDRHYFKLPPHFRYVAVAGGAIAGQVGVELRIIQVADVVVRTFGVVDLCVRDTARGHGLAGRLLTEVTTFAQACEMDFVVLFADDDRLYVRHGWSRVDNPCTWVKIHEHATLGLAEDVVPQTMMVKAVGHRSWPAGRVDLLGHLF
jgi:GNAT superfamily N-acetyltransferase